MDAEQLGQQLLHELQLELRWKPRGDPRNVAVKVLVETGIATLFGHVTDPSIRRQAETSAWRVLGVHSVVNEIELRHPEGEAQQDVGRDRSTFDVLEPAQQNSV